MLVSKPIFAVRLTETWSSRRAMTHSHNIPSRHRHVGRVGDYLNKVGWATRCRNHLALIDGGRQHLDVPPDQWAPYTLIDTASRETSLYPWLLVSAIFSCSRGIITKMRDRRNIWVQNFALRLSSIIKMRLSISSSFSSQLKKWLGSCSKRT